MDKSIPSKTMAESHSNGPRRWILLTLCLAVLVAQLDTSVVNLAVRPIQASFRIGIAPMQWVVDGYNLTYAVFLLSGGLLADLFGRRRVLVAGAAVFTLASLLCAAAPSVAVLIGGRVLAGFGAALLLPASLAIIRVVWADERERGWVLGIWTACNGLALAVGPAIGGALIGGFGWRSVFFVVVPIGVAALVLAVKVVPESRHAEGRRFDGLAQVLGVVALGGFTLAAIELDRAGWLAAAAF
ncbi:MAG: MFS transporter, partial [Pararhizobium sp.]